MIAGASAAQVHLVGADGSHVPGRIPAGTYTVEARFADGSVDRSTTIHLKDGGAVRLSCSAAMKSCVAL